MTSEVETSPKGHGASVAEQPDRGKSCEVQNPSSCGSKRGGGGSAAGFGSRLRRIPMPSAFPGVAAEQNTSSRHGCKTGDGISFEA